jgi:hypothetical protein
VPASRSPIVAVAIAVVALAVAAVVWRLTAAPGRDLSTAAGAIDGAPSDVVAPEIPGGRPLAAADAPSIVGCWRWANNTTVTIRGDGTMTAGPFTGRWEATGGRGFAFTWPGPVDTLTLSRDGRRLTGGNQYGVAVTATRATAGRDLVGHWTWGGIAPVDLGADGSATLGALSGRWTVGDASRRLYRVSWPAMRDTVVLSADGARLDGGNQYGVAVASVRLPGCS